MKDTKEMRKFLLLQMKGVAAGKIDTSTSKGICNLAQQVYNTMAIEINHAKALDKMATTKIPKVDF